MHKSTRVCSLRGVCTCSARSSETVTNSDCLYAHSSSSSTALSDSEHDRAMNVSSPICTRCINTWSPSAIAASNTGSCSCRNVSPSSLMLPGDSKTSANDLRK